MHQKRMVHLELERRAGLDCLHTQGGYEKLLLSVAGISHYCVCKQLRQD